MLIRSISRMPIILYSLGVPPQQFEQVRKECDGQLHELFRDRVYRMACQFPIEENYFAWQAFSRSYDTEKRKAIPEYLKEENYQTVKEGLDNVTLTLCSTVQFLKQQPDNSLNRFIFLDSQDWMDAEGITEQWSEIARVGQPGSRIIFRTGSDESPIESSLPSELMKRFVYEEERSKELF
jgi:S-adenosylmethionine-diacylglycerol 3-amino-3-carboxypropyl transferase